MIAASDLVEYIPGGREIAQRHPLGEKNSNSAQNSSLPKNTSFSPKFISDKKTNEFWIIRENDTCAEEELYFSGKVAVHLKGSQSARVLRSSYTSETNIKHALWCKFNSKIPEPRLKGVETKENNYEDKCVDSICLLDSYTLKVFTDTGEDYIASLQFQVSDAWSTKHGLLLEKAKSPSHVAEHTSENSSKSVFLSDTRLPVYYSISHPLNEICPVLIKHGSISYMSEPSQKVIFTSSEPSLALVYDKKTNLHSAYKIRQVTTEECQLICGNVNTSSALCRTKPNPYTTLNSSMQQQGHQHSQSQSSMPAVSHCHSMFLGLSGSSSNRQMSRGIALDGSHQAMASIMRQSIQKSNSSNNFNTMEFQECDNSRMLYPEIILDHVWTESSKASKDTFLNRASKAFLTTDLVGQNYLSYLVPNRSQLFLVRLEKSIDGQQLIFGMVTSIVAKDAVNLSKLNMIAVMDLSKGISLYSGTMFVAKVYIPNLMTGLISGNHLIPGLGRSVSSPIPRRSSLLSPAFSSLRDINKLEEDMRLLSPVGMLYNPSAAFMNNSLKEGQLSALKNAVGNKLILDYGNQNYYRVTLPQSTSSPLVSKCLHILKSVLQRDLAMELLIKWYTARNAPGLQNFSPAEEWHLFLVVLFTLLGYKVDKLPLIQLQEMGENKEHNDSIIAPKKQKPNECNEDWLYVLNSEQHKKSRHFLTEILGLTEFSSSYEAKEQPSSNLNNANGIDPQASLFLYLPHTLFSLHLLYEELKLDCQMSESLPMLAELLHQLSSDLRFDLYVDHYFRDFPRLCRQGNSPSQISEAALQRIISPNYMTVKPPSVFETLHSLMNYADIAPYPYMNQVNPRTRNIIYLTALIAHENRAPSLKMEKFVKLIVPVGSRADLFETSSKEQEIPQMIEHPEATNITLLYHKMGMRKEDFQIFPPAIALIFKDVMHRCREQPPSNWPNEVYELVDRQDLAALEKHPKPDDPENGTDNYSVNDPERIDGMEFDRTILKLRFNQDHRVAEVRRLLGSSQPVKIAIAQTPDISDHEFIKKQERQLHALCRRTMALPVARGMFTLRTSTPITTEQLPIPRLCLKGISSPGGTTIELTHTNVPLNMDTWPLFHNGVAAGLQICPNAPSVDSTWIVYNKRLEGQFAIEHSGFLMALGLNGLLKNLSPTITEKYLQHRQETTSIGFLLGLSATYRGTKDAFVTKVLSLNLECLLPSTSIELSQNVQVAALLGIGLVYQQSAYRYVAQILLAEIGRPPGPEMKNHVNRESYSVAAGMALGLVLLGHGEGELVGITDTLRRYMIGGSLIPYAGSQKDKYESLSYHIREGDWINTDVTSPGATIALGFMYFNSGNHAVADWMRAPNMQSHLDSVRPDFLLLRTLAKSFILWDEIEPTKTWISSHLPEIINKYAFQKPTPKIIEEVDLETINQAYCNIIAGACMALGLKYAGTADQNAFKTLYNYIEMFMTFSHKAIAELIGKSMIETCLNVVLLSAAVVMAGTGNLEIMRICRHMRTRVGSVKDVVTYGSHMANHMALALLFLGGGRYTLSNSPSAVADLVISLFPNFPTHSNDNRYHLQAFRHFYVLAAEPRLLLPKDIDNRQFCFAKVHVTFADGQEVALKAPCLLPKLDSLTKIVLKDERYWQIVFEKGHNWDQLKGMLGKCRALDVKQRAGCLSYQEDPNGFRSLMTQGLTMEDVVVWAARPEHITSFTNDKTILNMVDYFLTDFIQDPQEDSEDLDSSLDRIIQDTSKHLVNGSMPSETALESSNVLGNQSHKMNTTVISNAFGVHPGVVSEVVRRMSNKEKLFLQTFATIVYECVVKDKVSLLPIWVNLYKTIEDIEKRPTSFMMWQVKLISSRALCKNFMEENNKLLSLENILAIKEKTARVIDSWESELQPLVYEYMTSGTEMIKNENTLDKLCAYLTFYDIPYKMDRLLKSDPSLKNWVASEVPIITLYKLFKIMKLQR